jgi:hypothetical protein
MRNDKFDGLVHYVIWKCPDVTKLGATKLNKILWFADAIHYLRTGQPITAARYVKQQHGPVPKGFLKTRARLEKNGAIAIAEGEFYGYPQTRFMALRRPDISCFTADEISLVDEIIETIRDGHTATSISAMTHDRVWEAAAIGEEMPLHAIYAWKEGELTDEDMEWATEQCDKLGLTA